jgi:hypothetical protein
LAQSYFEGSRPAQARPSSGSGRLDASQHKELALHVQPDRGMDTSRKWMQRFAGLEGQAEASATALATIGR